MYASAQGKVLMRLIVTIVNRVTFICVRNVFRGSAINFMNIRYVTLMLELVENYDCFWDGAVMSVINEEIGKTLFGSLPSYLKYMKRRT